MRRCVKIVFRLLFVLSVIALTALCVFRIRYHSEIRELAQTQVINSTSDLINDAIDSQIESGNISYDRIVFFEKDLDGRITALKTNMTEVNRLKTEILNRINDEILALDTSSIGIPLGSLLLPELFSGRGPEIPVQILSIRNSDASFQPSRPKTFPDGPLRHRTLSMTTPSIVPRLTWASSLPGTMRRKPR